MSKTGSNEPEANGMKTKIVVVDGADGLTPDMLRAPERPDYDQIVKDGLEKFDKAKDFGRIFRDPMHE